MLFHYESENDFSVEELTFLVQLLGICNNDDLNSLLDWLLENGQLSVLRKIS